MSSLMRSFFCGLSLLPSMTAAAEAAEDYPAPNTTQKAEQDPIGGNGSDDLATCYFPKDHDAWIDSLREGTHRRLCLTAKWLDSRFGDTHEFDDEHFRGKVSLAMSYDSIESFDPKLRVRVKTKLPNISSRLSAFIGRVEEDSYVSNTEGKDDSFNNRQLRSSDNDGADWLVGLGYQNPNSTTNGFDYSIGAKLSSGINPYAKVAYRYHYQPTDINYWRATQTLFWRGDEKLGVSSNLEYTHLIGDNDIIEWESSVKYTGEAERLEWVTGATWHHSLSNDRGISSRIYFKGEDREQALVPEYGVTFLYVRPFFRPWLNIETGVDLRRERSPESGEYENAIKFGVQFEMLLGDYYSRDYK